MLADSEGLFTETAGGVTVSALRILARDGVIKPNESVVALITGNGLKTIELMEPYLAPVTINPTVESFDANIEGRIKQRVA